MAIIELGNDDGVKRIDIRDMCNIVALSANNDTSAEIMSHYSQSSHLIMRIEAAEESSFLPNVISTITMIAMPLIMGTGFNLYLALKPWIYKTLTKACFLYRLFRLFWECIARRQFSPGQPHTTGEQ